MIVALSMQSFGQNSSGRLIEFPFEDQFKKEVPLNIMRDKHGIVWFITMGELYYILQDDTYEYTGLHGVELDYPNFIDMGDGSVYLINKRSFFRVESPTHAAVEYDISAMISPQEGVIVQDAAPGRPGELILNTGSGADRKLWSFDLKSGNHHLIHDDIGNVWDMYLTEDRYVLVGSSLRYLWKDERSPVIQEIDLQGFFNVPRLSLDIAYGEKDKVYIYSDNGMALCHDLSTEATLVLDFGEPVFDIFSGAKGPTALTTSGRLSSLNSGPPDSYKDINSQLASTELSSQLAKGSRVIKAEGDDLWLTSNNGLLYWSTSSSGFQITAVPDAERVTNVHIDSERDKRWTLSATKGIQIFKNSTGQLLKRIELDSRGKQIQGFKWRFINEKFYIYSLNGFFSLDLDTDEMTYLIDPFYMAGKNYEKRFNTLEVNTQTAQVYLGTKDNHLLNFDTNTGEHRVIALDENPERKRNLVFEIDLLPDGNLLVLGEKALYHVSTPALDVTLAREHWQSIPKQVNGDRSGIRVVHDSLLVISTFGNGISILNLNKDSLYRCRSDVFRKADISDIFWDERDNVYGTSKQGLLSYHIPTNTMSLLNLESVIDNQNFHYRYMYCDSPGEMYLGLIDSYVHFNSANVAGLRRKPPVLRSLAINGQQYFFNDNSQANRPLSLDYTRNYLSVSLAHPWEPQASNRGLLYRLNGLHDDWRVGTRNQTIQYDALASGDYSLEVKNISDDPAYTLLKATILPPMWKTPWFIAAGIGFIGLIALWFYRVRMRFVQREAELLAKHELELAQLEMKSLRAQMNPHFLFNSLNSIKSFIAQNEPRIATRYLTKFSHLIRLILNNSREPLVSLDQELKALELYIELEQLRFEHSFDYRITLDPSLDSSDFLLPPLILQPYVENAIWHGLLHKTGNRLIEININAVSDGISASIKDNGIGRSAARINKSKTATKHKSLGMSITADRISKAHDGQRTDGIQILDLVAPDGESLGTEVKIHLPTKIN